ncbi:myelin transcription factor 1-like protein, partial [Tigriopus californicus]|uniref:myelin transcription factor 1-like protein n=1 Tax=Tigriopus californicus TaxID=6832 RepID=UPI0027DA43E6
MLQQRPKSAVRRRTVDRDETDEGVGIFDDDNTEGDDLSSEGSDEDNEEDEGAVLDQEIEFHDFDREEHGEEIDEQEAEERLKKKALTLKFFDQAIHFTNVEDPSSAEKVDRSVNHRGVQDLFSDILYSEDPVEIVNLESYNEESSPGSESDDENEKVGMEPKYQGISKSFVQSLHDSQVRMARRNTDTQIASLERPEPYLHAYPELQRSSGLKVLRRIFERKKSLEINQQEVKNAATLKNEALTPQDFEQFRKKP